MHQFWHWRQYYVWEINQPKNSGRSYEVVEEDFDDERKENGD